MTTKTIYYDCVNQKAYCFIGTKMKQFSLNRFSTVAEALNAAYDHAKIKEEDRPLANVFRIANNHFDLVQGTNIIKTFKGEDALQQAIQAQSEFTQSDVDSEEEAPTEEREVPPGQRVVKFQTVRVLKNGNIKHYEYEKLVDNIVRQKTGPKPRVNQKKAIELIKSMHEREIARVLTFIESIITPEPVEATNS